MNLMNLIRFSQIGTILDTEVTKPVIDMMPNDKVFAGALQEFVDAHNDLVAANYKGAIHNSAKSFESILKIILGTQEGNASELLRALTKRGFFDELPSLTKGIADSVYGFAISSKPISWTWSGG